MLGSCDTPQKLSIAPMISFAVTDRFEYMVLLAREGASALVIKTPSSALSTEQRSETALVSSITESTTGDGVTLFVVTLFAGALLAGGKRLSENGTDIAIRDV